MRFGIALETFSPPGKNPNIKEIFKMADLAESLAFDSVWTWDHILLGSKKVFPVLDSPTLLASIGARTRTIRLGTSVLIMALRNPIVLAKVLSTIQYITNGRLILGAGAGWYEKEFMATGTDFSVRGQIFERRFTLVRKLLNESDLSYNEDGFVLDHASMEPKSTEKIPMVIGGYSDRVLERAGRVGDGWISYYYTPMGFAESWLKVEKSAKESGRDSSSLKRINIVPLSIAESFSEADKAARDFTSRYMDLPKNTGCNVESSIRGTVEECIEQIEKFRKAGVEDLVFIPANYDHSIVEKAGKEILPAFLK
ncbi:MAG: LLM class flavin-dependent oxidoreductase [Nitrososphaerales archaeon]